MEICDYQVFTKKADYWRSNFQLLRSLLNSPTVSIKANLPDSLRRVEKEESQEYEIHEQDKLYAENYKQVEAAI